MAHDDRRGAGRPRHAVPREVLLEQAAGVFAAQGYAGASLRDISLATGLSKGTLLHHFDSKEALYVATMAHAVEVLGALVADARLGGGDFVERLDRLSLGLTRVLGERPHLARMLLREMADAGPYLSGPGREPVRAVLGQASEFAARAMDAGVFRRQDPAGLVLSILGLHTLWFGSPTMVALGGGRSVSDPDAIGTRAAEVCAQVRRLCGCDPSSAPEQAQLLLD